MVRDPSSAAFQSSLAFAGGIEPASFYCGPAEDEALARLEWLVAERQRCGLIVADSGMGKSHLAAAAGRRLAGLGAEVALLSLAGLPEEDWTELLLARLPLDPASRNEPLRPWLKLENRLRENALMGRPTVLVFDDLDRAPVGVREGVARLAAAGEARFATTVVVATATPAGLGLVPEAVRQRAAVRIDLTGWSAADVAAFLATELKRAGLSAELFSPAATATIQRFARGLPRDVRRLAHLAVAVAGGEGLAGIDAATIEQVWRELAPPDAVPLPATAASEPDGPQAGAQVRPVRRLWG
jgi:type II secretory pathway predicted ATPase ExeA